MVLAPSPGHGQAQQLERDWRENEDDLPVHAQRAQHLPGAAQDAHGCDQKTSVRHRAPVHECGGVAGDEHKDFGRVAKSVIADCQPTHDVRGDMIEEDQPQGEAAEQVQPQVALGCNGWSHQATIPQGENVMKL